MRIEVIEIKNFGSYVNACVDLRDVSAAVITGLNGAGKSTAFVDAVLWTLFGKCRAATDAMLRLGSNDMTVSVSFFLSGTHYKVLRTRSLQTKAGKSELQLFIGDHGQDWQPISGARLADTQQKILDLLNLDYDLLTATGFLLQGNADRFSRATPAERKAILAQILRLDLYATLKQSANREAIKIQARLADMKADVDAAAKTAGAIESLQTEAEAVQKKMRDSRAEIVALDEQERVQIGAKAGMEANLAALDQVNEQIFTESQKQGKLSKQEEELKAKQLRVAKILENKGQIEAKVKEEEALKADEKLMRRAIEICTSEIEDAHKKVQKIQSFILAVKDVENLLAMAERRVADEIAVYDRETDLQKQVLETARKSVGLLKVVPCGVNLQAKCQFTKDAVKAEAWIPGAEAVTEARNGEAKASPDSLKVVADLTEQVDTAHALRYDLQLQEKIADVDKKLRTKEKIQGDLKALGKNLDEVEKFTALASELKVAEAEKARIEKDLADLVVSVLEVASEIDRLLKLTADRPKIARDIVTLTDQLESISKSQTVLREDEHHATQLFGQITERIQNAIEANAKAIKLQQDLDAQTNHLWQYQVLVDAYAQIPVLVLESAIPLLEQEANGILAKISPSGMRVRLDTQKALKSREGLAETLEIVVRDVYGERPYENYSGGEKFRLDLALRIGLSKLLANRAGARLDTLVIDEGLGSLDEDGLAQLRECLAALGQEFPLVLVVTHIEAMKHTFPAQIIVSKDGHGSQIEVVTG